ncbi:MAG TPA: NADH-quinone oxidoreductase subunit N [Ktedonobacterales bacterium]|nr:NADH-quinone oxidoreductase subunit N [Ktedonobacterales bacterium]
MGPFTYTPPSGDWLLIVPELIVLGVALVVLMADLASKPGRKGWLSIVCLLGVVAAGAAAAMLWTDSSLKPGFFGMIGDDQLALYSQLVILFAAAIGLLFSPGYVERQDIKHEGEYYALLLLATLGMMLMASGTNLMILFVGLEVLSLALYVLCAIVGNRERAQESGMKYFLLSSFSSAFLLYGMALTYGSTGSTRLDGIRTFIESHPFVLTSGYGPLLVAGLSLMAVGFSFKVSAVPFQAWTPDVYVGAPTSVTAFMSVGTKVAAFAGLIRVFVYALGGLQAQWEPLFWVLAILTMVGGNLLAVTQQDVKRMLAYSSVANAGYMLVGVATGTLASMQGLLIYLAAYAVMNLGAFGVVLAIERNDGQGTTLEDFAGLARRRPQLAALMALFLFALAGIPATAGFIGKWYVFYSAIVGNHLELAIIGVLASVLGMFYYLRVIWAMYFTDAQQPATAEVGVGGAPPPSVHAAVASSRGGVAVAEPVARVRVAPTARAQRPPVPIHPATWIGLVVAAVLTLVLGIVPSALVQLADQAAHVLFR